MTRSGGPTDTADRKRLEHAIWTQAAPGWNKHHAFLRRCTSPVSERMIAWTGATDVAVCAPSSTV